MIACPHQSMSLYLSAFFKNPNDTAVLSAEQFLLACIVCIRGGRREIACRRLDCKRHKLGVCMLSTFLPNCLGFPTLFHNLHQICILSNDYIPSNLLHHQLQPD